MKKTKTPVNFKTNIYIVVSSTGRSFAVGMTKRSFNERHKDTDWNKLRSMLAAEGMSLHLLRWYEDVNFPDHDVHAFLKYDLEGVFRPKLGEFFAFDSKTISMDRIVNEIENKFIIQKNHKKEVLVPRSYQKEFVAKAQAEYLEFLLFAKCRSGKCSMTYLHIVDKNYRVSIVCSYRKSPEEGWAEDLVKFSNFDNIVLINTSKKYWQEDLKYFLEQTDKQIVLWATVQGLYESRLAQIKEITSVDFLAIDECHIGGNGKGAKQYKDVRNQLINVPCLNISGTAYQQIWIYPEEKSFVYSYFEEQLDNLRGVFTPLRPKMIVKIIKYLSKEYHKIFGDDPDAMKNIFVLNEDKDDFLYPELVRDFIRLYFGPQRHIKNFKDRLLHSAQHLLIALPNQKVCHLFADLISQYYEPLVVTSDTKKTPRDIDKFIRNNINGKTITITCEANVLGVTQKKWDTIINCKEGSSKEFWTQFAFRGGSGDKDWAVIDFCPQRCVESLHSYYVASCQRNPELRNRKLLEFVAIFEYADGHKELSQEDIYEILAADSACSSRMVSDILNHIDYSKLDELDIDLSLKPSKSKNNSKVVNNNNGNGKSCEVYSPSDDEESSSDDEHNQKINSLKAITDSIPLVVYWEMRDGNTINSIDSVLNSQYYVKITKDVKGSLKQALDTKLFDSELLMYRLTCAISTISASMKKDRTVTLYELSTTKNENRSIPLDFLDEVCPLEIFV